MGGGAHCVGRSWVGSDHFGMATVSQQRELMEGMIGLFVVESDHGMDCAPAT